MNFFNWYRLMSDEGQSSGSKVEAGTNKRENAATLVDKPAVIQENTDAARWVIFYTYVILVLPYYY